MDVFIEPGLLADNADSVKEDYYSLPLTGDELITSKDDLATMSIEIKRRETEEKKRRKLYKVELDPYVEVKDKLIDEIKTGVREKHGKIFMLSDQKAGIMASYSEEGHLLNERPLQPEEKQLTVTKEAANM